MTEIFKKYRALLDELSESFAEITDKQGEWTEDYTLWITDYEAWDIDDMMYVVNNLEKLLDRYSHIPERKERLNCLLEDIEEWIDYNADVAIFNIQYINLKSWLMGAPRMSKDERLRLHRLRDRLEQACTEAQEQYGRAKEGSQPEHLRDLKNKSKQQ